MKEIGERLREFRQSKKMKQVDMSKVLGISVPASSKIETGVNELTTKHLLTLKREFEISVDWLLFGESANDTKAFGSNEAEIFSRNT
jgi:transcriptional regulator with XRE-family HTH domain